MSSPSPIERQDLEADAQMREMMGFASFGMQKPESSAPASSGLPSQTSIAPGPRFDNRSVNLPAKPNFAQPVSGTTTGTSMTEKAAGSAASSTGTFPNTYSQVVYTNSATGISFTRQQLFEYAQGQRTNEKGDVMYFRPSFLDEDPWRALRNKK